MKRTDRWDKFVQEYVIDFDRSRAYKAAGFKPKTFRQAQQNATRLLTTNEYIINKVSEELKKQEKKAEKKADDVIRELEKVGFSNIQDYI